MEVTFGILSSAVVHKWWFSIVKRTILISVTLLMGFGSATLLGDEGDEGAERVSSQKSSRSRSTYPPRSKRVDGPLRDTNISDIEVQEVQRVVAGIYPGAIVNIGGVVSECPCADGLACSAQVWVVAYGLGQSHGLMLSKIESEWQLGPVQSWWLVYEELLVRMRRALIRGGAPVPTHLESSPWHRSSYQAKGLPNRRESIEEYHRLAGEQALLFEKRPKCPTDIYIRPAPNK